jgi:hypothetical protein
VIRGSWFVKEAALMRCRFLYGDFAQAGERKDGLRIGDFGLREGVPLMRHIF